MDIIEYILNNKTRIFLASSILMFIIYGIDNWHYLEYNLTQYDLMINNHLYKNEPYVNFVNSFGFMNLFTIWFNYFLTVPWAFLLSSLIIKTLIFFMVYRISVALISEEKIAFLSTFIFLLSTESTTHGIVHNGMWGSPIFFRASVSALFTLLGISSALRNKFMLSSIFFIFSVCLHSLNGLTALVFFGSSFSFYLFSQHKKIYKKIFISATLLLISILYIFYNAHQSTLNYLPNTEISIKEWFRHCNSIEPDDVSMLWSLGAFGFGLIPLLIFSGYLVYKKKGSDILRHLYTGSVIAFIIIIVFEFLHRIGIFFGKVSEYFIGIEFRRGLWVLMFYSITLIVKYIYEITTKESNSNGKSLFLYFLFICTYICPNIAKVILLVFMMLWLNLNIRTVLFSFIFGIMLLFHIRGQYPYSLSHHEAINGLVAFIGYSLIYFVLRIRKINNYIILLVSIAVCLLPTIKRSLFQNKFLTDLKILANRGIFERPDNQKLIIEVYKSQGYDIDENMVEKIKKRNTLLKMILYPLSETTYSDRILFGAPLFLTIRDISASTFLKSYYWYFKSRIQEISLYKSLKITTFEFRDKEDLIKQVDDMYRNLTISQLAYLKKKYNLGIIVTPTQYDSLELIYYNKKYNVYDLSALDVSRNVAIE